MVESQMNTNDSAINIHQEENPESEGHMSVKANHY